MNESQTRFEKNDPALKEAGWNTPPFKLATEQAVAPGRVGHDGRSHKPEKADYDILDVMLDIAYDVEPVTREMRAQRAEAESRATLAGERMALFRVIVANYVRDGVWTLTAESFRDLLLQRYGSLGEAYGRLLFHSANEALAYYGTIQHALFAA